MRRVLLEVELDPATASFERAREKFGLTTEQVDARFGLIDVDRDAHRYVMKVDVDAAERVSGRSYPRAGTAANPGIRLVQ